MWYCCSVTEPSNPSSAAPSPREDLRSRIADLKRRQILDAAAAVFAEQGFSRATMRDVAARAGIATGTIYNHFDDKDALLRALMHRLNESDERPADLAAAKDDPATYLRHRLACAGGDLATLQVILSEALVDPAFREVYRDEILGPTFAAAEKQLRRAGKRTKKDALSLRLVSASVIGLLILRILGEPATLAGWKQLPDMLASLFFASEGASR
jgi:AcrR family transcriptional regulator